MVVLASAGIAMPTDCVVPAGPRFAGTASSRPSAISGPLGSVMSVRRNRPQSSMSSSPALSGGVVAGLLANATASNASMPSAHGPVAVEPSAQMPPVGLAAVYGMPVSRS